VKVEFFELSDANRFFEAMNQRYPYAKCVKLANGIVKYEVRKMNASDESDRSGKRLGYCIPDDGFYLIVDQ